MKKIHFLILVVLGSHICLAQDTLSFTNKEIKVVKIIEVGLKDVTYKRFENLEGPSYIVNKSEISYVKYANGQVEKFNAVEVINPVSVNTSSVMNFVPVTVYHHALYQSGNKLGMNSIEQILNNYPVPQKREILLQQFKDYKKYNSNQQAFNGLAALGFVIPAITSVLTITDAFASSSSNPDIAKYFVGGIVLGAATRITGFALTKMYRNKRFHKLDEIANTYNSIGK